MKKCFLLAFIFSIIAFILFGTQQKAIAAGEVYTWAANNSINVTGGQVYHPPATLPYVNLGALGIGGYSYGTSLNIIYPQSPQGFCLLIFGVIVSADGHTGKTNVPTTSKLNTCPQNIVNQYSNKIVQIIGTPPNIIKSDKKVDILYDSTTTNPVIFTFTKQNCKQNCTQTITPTIKKIADCVNQYEAVTNLDPGTYKLIAPGFIIQTFTKSSGAFTQTYYNTGLTPNFFNGNLKQDSVNIGVLVQKSSGTGPYTVTLNGNKVNLSAKTALDTGGTGNAGTCANLTASFCSVPPGTYNICIKGLAIACQSVTKKAGTVGTATFDASGLGQVGLGANNCNVAVSGAPTLPPPPSPPCITWNNGTCSSFQTGFGAISTNPSGFIQTLFAMMLSLSGGIAVLLIIRSGYTIMTSQGKPEQLQQGREQLTAAIVGLLFLIFSFVILQLIGVDILHIPGFGK